MPPFWWVQCPGRRAWRGRTCSRPTWPSSRRKELLWTSMRRRLSRWPLDFHYIHIYVHSICFFFGGGEYYYISIILFSDILLKICDLISQLQLMNTGSESAYPENVVFHVKTICLSAGRHTAASCCCITELQVSKGSKCVLLNLHFVLWLILKSLIQWGLVPSTLSSKIFLFHARVLFTKGRRIFVF